MKYLLTCIASYTLFMHSVSLNSMNPKSGLVNEAFIHATKEFQKLKSRNRLNFESQNLSELVKKFTEHNSQILELQKQIVLLNKQINEIVESYAKKVNLTFKADQSFLSLFCNIPICPDPRESKERGYVSVLITKIPLYNDKHELLKPSELKKSIDSSFESLSKPYNTLLGENIQKAVDTIPEISERTYESLISGVYKQLESIKKK